MLMYHYKDGWHFGRNEDGSVTIRVDGLSGDDVPHAEVVIDADGWASIVAHVSVHGDHNPYWQAALDFHNGVGMKEGSS